MLSESYEIVVHFFEINLNSSFVKKNFWYNLKNQKFFYDNQWSVKYKITLCSNLKEDYDYFCRSIAIITDNFNITLYPNAN